MKSCVYYQCRDRYTKKCQQLEKENDEQKDKLNEMMKNQKSYVSAYQRSAKKYESLSKKLEVAEIEVLLVYHSLLTCIFDVEPHAQKFVCVAIFTLIRCTNKF